MLYRIIGTNLPALELVALVVAYILALIVAFGMHEFSHAYVSYKLGDPTPKLMGRLTPNPVKHIDPLGIICLLLFGFGWGKPVIVNPLAYRHYRKGMVMVSLAGVTMNLILAFVFSGIYYFAFSYIYASRNMMLVCVNYFLEYMVILNLSLFTFNLLPIYPLDGFNFIKSILPATSGSKFEYFMAKYGIIFMIILLATPLFDFIFSYVTNGLLDIFFKFWGLF